MHRPTTVTACLTAVAVATLGATAVAGATTQGASAGKTPVYQGKVTGRSIALSGSPAAVVATPALPAGSYLVDYAVGTSLGAGAGVACAAGITAGGPSNDGLFGGSGNGSATSGVYGTATMTDTVTVATAGSTISVWCTDAAADSHATLASITALKVSSVTQ
jgi:hypothetical protein